MSQIKPSSHGIVVENKESGVRYAVSDANFNPKSERKVRDLKPGESVIGYAPKDPKPGWSADAEVSEEDSAEAGPTSAPKTAGAETEATKTTDTAKPTPTK